MASNTSMLKYFPGLVAAAIALLVTPIHLQAQSEDALLPELGNGIAAIAEGKIITIEKLRQEMEPIVPRLRTQARTEKEFAESIRQVSREVLQNMIDRILIVKAAEKEGLLIPPSYIDQEYEEVLNRDFGGDRSRLLSYLQAQGLTPREFRENIYNRVVINFMRQKNRKSQSEISPERIQEFYVQNKICFYQDESIRLRQIILTPQANESIESLRQTANKIIQELDEGANFSDVAQKYSADKVGRKGGDWGWIKRQDIRTELCTVAFSLEPGEYSQQPVELGETIFILFCEDKHEEMIQPVNEVRDVIENLLAGEIARKTQERWLQNIRENSYVRYFM
jgi:peptidyl-prolyl cis-trans isomerase SurA